MRQAAVDPAGGDAGDRVRRSGRRSAPTGRRARCTRCTSSGRRRPRPRRRAACRRTSGSASLVVRRHLDAGQRGDVEARLVEHHDDVRQLAGCLAGRAHCARRRPVGRRRRRPPARRASSGRRPRPRPSARTWRRDCGRRTRPRGRSAARTTARRAPRSRATAPTSGEAAPHPERLEPPQQHQQRQRQQHGRAATFQARPGIMVSRNEKVSTSMIITSTKVTVIIRMRCLKCDSRIRTTDHGERQRGRGQRPAQQRQPEQLSRPQVSRKATPSTSSCSEQSSRPSAAR